MLEKTKLLSIIWNMRLLEFVVMFQSSVNTALPNTLTINAKIHTLY